MINHTQFFRERRVELSGDNSPLPPPSSVPISTALVLSEEVSPLLHPNLGPNPNRACAL